MEQFRTRDFQNELRKNARKFENKTLEHELRERFFAKEQRIKLIKPCHCIKCEQVLDDYLALEQKIFILQKQIAEMNAKKIGLISFPNID